MKQTVLITSLSVFLATLFLAMSVSAGEPRQDAEEAAHHPHAALHGKHHGLHNMREMHWLGSPGGGFLGVGLTELTPELRAHFGVPDETGVMVNKVVEDSPAAAAGLEVGDIITLVGDESINSPMSLVKAVRHVEEPRTLDIEYWRDGSLHQTSAAIEIRERKVFDLGKLDLEGLEKLDKLHFNLGPEILEQVNQSLESVLDSDAWKIHMEKLQEVNVEKIEERMEELKERMEELEQKLERKLDPDA